MTEQSKWNAYIAVTNNPYGAAAIMGNQYAESGLKSTNLQNSYEKSLGYTDSTYTAAVDNGTYNNFVRDSAGYGLSQWTYWSRKQGLLDYARSLGVSIGDDDMQVYYTIKELSEGYKSVLKSLQSATSLKSAVKSFLTGYEKPADQSNTAVNTRTKYAQVYYDKYASVDISPLAHVVVKGDTLSAIAAKYGTTVSVLATYNNISNPDLIYVGQIIYIPEV